ncbi:MAG: hypothetical protein D6683_13530 [Actinomyces sp.]|nr:MAG: hypothetical protein D6683_13530 [Actinomyces sp.]
MSTAAAWHLVRRFAGSLRPGGPSRRDREWVARTLGEAEYALWRRLSGPDRRHSVAVARGVVARLGEQADRPVVAAALLHDVGKLDAGLRTPGRVIATLSGLVAGRDTARLWSEGRGFTRRVGLYLRHPELGGDRLEMIGSHPLVVAWAREHHLPPERWSVDPEIGAVLAAVDDD